MSRLRTRALLLKIESAEPSTPAYVGEKFPKLSCLASMVTSMIKEGNKAPAFTLPASTGGKAKLSDYKEKIVVLYFYPRDNTPGCTTEAKEFQAAIKSFQKAGAVILGVSKDSIESHCKFADKLGLDFALLSDPDGKVIEKYGAWGEKNMYGKKSMGLIRTTVVIGSDGRVKKIFPRVRVKGHVDKVLAVVQELSEEE